MVLPFSSRFWGIYIRLQDSNIFLLMPVQDMRLKSGGGDAMDGPDAAKLSPPGVSGGLPSGPDLMLSASCLLPSAPNLLPSAPCLLPSASCLLPSASRLSAIASARRRSNCGSSCSTGSSAFTMAGRGTNLTAHIPIFSSSQGLTPGKSVQTTCRPQARASITTRGRPS